MTDVQMLVGSLSNDLYRIASLKQRGSHTAANKFLIEAKRWSSRLELVAEKQYIKDIAKEVSKTSQVGLDEAETFLMYGTLLQNYALHNM
ncbi:MAG: hypothetical protein ABI758_00590 [Candidatus Woesebacteria bacterium]